MFVYFENKATWRLTGWRKSLLPSWLVTVPHREIRAVPEPGNSSSFVEGMPSDAGRSSQPMSILG
jgi:hypothetical protein